MITQPESLQGGDAMFSLDCDWGREVLWLEFVFTLMPCAVCGHGEPQGDVSRPRGQHKLKGFVSLEAREARRDSPLCTASRPYFEKTCDGGDVRLHP